MLLTKDDERNIYERYIPKMVETVTLLVKGKLKKTEFATLSQSRFDDAKRNSKKKVLVFVIGGITYQENRELQLAGSREGFQAIAGSNIIINSEK